MIGCSTCSLASGEHASFFQHPFFRWFTGGDTQYMTLRHCMSGDVLWIAITVALDLAVAAGYVLIALHWWRNERFLPPSPARTALARIRNIFIFCGVCGYVFIPIKMVWPAWRLYDMVMLVLAYYTWRYALGARDLKVVYAELGRSKKLAEDLHQSRRDLEQSREDLEASRRESQRKSFFLNAISHDLRTPLNGLLLQGSLAEISAAKGDAKTLKASMDAIKDGALAAGDLLDGFLEYARTEAGADPATLADVDLAEVINAVVTASAADAAKKGLTLRAQVPAGLVVRSDPRRLERILHNLVANAVKFTDKGSVRVEVERERGGLNVHVIDTGVGVAPEDQARLFEEFYQVSNAERNRRKGFGLGLTIAQRLARQLGGDVTVESSLGHGSRFTVVLPAATNGSSEDDAASGPGASGNGHAVVADRSLAEPVALTAAS